MNPTPDALRLARRIVKQLTHLPPDAVTAGLFDWSLEMQSAILAINETSERAAKLADALAPFAAVADEYDDAEDDTFEVWQDAGPIRTIRASFRLEHYRRARAAIRALKETPDAK